MSEEWLAAVRSLKDGYRGDAFDEEGFRVNALVTGAPFGEGELELHSGHGPVIGWSPGLDPDASVTITIGYDTARELVLDRSPNALELALGADEIHVDGDFDELRDWWHSRVGDDDITALERDIRAITA